MPQSSKLTPSDTNRLTPFVRAFLKRVQNTAATHALWQPKDRFIIGVSGGADSLCLLDVLFLLSQKNGFALHVAHVNYRLRGTDSDLDEQFVRERCRAYGLEVSVLRPKRTSATNLEEKLRILRYRFFEKIRKQKQASLITVAHHRDDQAETVLLRLLRGSGLRGLAAMRARHGHIVRPLIDVSRQDILRYLTERGLSYRTDKSNTDERFLRNRIRQELLPLLEMKYQPNIRTILAHTAETLASDYALLDNTILLPITRFGNDLSFSIHALRHMTAEFLRHQLRLLLMRHFNGKTPPKSVIDELLKLMRSTKSRPGSLTLHGLKVVRKGDTVTLLDFQS